VIPQFVLRELQLVADSADSLKRNRGRRGLDILAAHQKSAAPARADHRRRFPERPEVDMKIDRAGALVQLQDRYQRFQPE